MTNRELAQKTIEKTIQKGAAAAEAYLRNGRNLYVENRDQKVEIMNQATTKGIGLRVIADSKMAYVSSTDLSDSALEDLSAKAVALAREATADENNVLPMPTLMEPRTLHIHDPSMFEMSMEDRIFLIQEIERVALALHPLVVKIDNSWITNVEGETTIANSNGLLESYQETWCDFGIGVVAEGNNDQRSGWGYSYARSFKDLPTLEELADRAVKRAVPLLGAAPVETQVAPVVFDPMAGRSVLGGIAGAINGDSVYKKSSFLVDKLGEKIGSDLVTVMDDGLLGKGLGSAPVDDEGVPTQRKTILDKGVLKGYVYDTATAKKAGATSTGNAQRGSYERRPGIGTCNFYLQKGNMTPRELLSGIQKGLYVFYTLGSATNVVTGDFSVGAVGLWIENGELTKPVAKVTIASNLLDMLKNMDAVADDLVFDRSRVCPTFRVAEMTISGT
jgi:PmbA protein